MLLELLDKTIVNVDRLDAQQVAPAMLAQIRRHRPEVLDRLLDGSSVPPDRREAMCLGIAAATVATVKKLPVTIQRLVDVLQSDRYAIGTRCAVASSLAYVAQPRDLVPDDAAGGYGYIDDSILAHAALIEFAIDTGDETEKTLKSLYMMAAFLPEHVVPQIQQAVDGLSTLYQMMRGLPPFVLESIMMQIVANPLAATQGATVSPTAFHPAPSVGGGFFGKSGAYVEGNDIIFPGGAGLVGGKVFIP